MGVLRTDFLDRVDEIESYFNFIEKIENGNKVLTDYSKTTTTNIDDKLEKILKSTAFLLLYNLIESTILNSITDIFDEISVKNISYSMVNPDVKKYWIKHKLKFDENTKKKTMAENFHHIVSQILEHMPLMIEKEHVEYGGSLETAKIKAICKEIGIKSNHFKCRKNDNGYKVFEEIKIKRNELAHGKFSFSKIAERLTYKGSVRERAEGGQIIDSFGLVHFKKYTIQLLSSYIDDIEEYIASEGYKIAP